jgi:hypothetical protein
MRSLGARLDDPAVIGDGHLCFKITATGGSFFYLDNVLIIENMPGYRVQFHVTDQNNEPLPETVVTFNDNDMVTNGFGYATWRDIDDNTYNYTVSYKGEEIESGTLEVYEDMVMEIVWNTTGIKKIEKSKIEIFPNPVADAFTVTGIYNGKLKLMDLNGKIVKALDLTKATVVNIEDLPMGVYLIEINTEGQTSTTRIIKTR